MDATVLIATYNRAPILRDTIQAILAQQTPPGLSWEILIVDNNSRDDTRVVVERYADASPVPLHYLFEGRQGKSYALNAGLGQAQGGVVVFTDDDVVLPRNWLATALGVLDRWGADGGGGRILPIWETPPPSWLANNSALWSRLGIMEIETQQVLQDPPSGPAKIWGANMVFRRSVFDQVGFFDVELGPNGDRPVNFEDVDMVERALRKGLRVVYDPELVIYHRIQKEQMRMSHFRRWAFVTGRAEALRKTTAIGGFPLFERPLWLYLRMAALFGEWLVASLLRRPTALELQFDLLTHAGHLWWYREGARRTRAGS